MVHPRVFISGYKADLSHPDMQFAGRLLADLSASGVIVATSGANDTMERLNQALKHCQWFVLVQTPASLASSQVRAEVDTALILTAQGKLRGALAIAAAPVDPQSLPPNWAGLRLFDAVQNYQQALVALQSALELGRSESVTLLAGGTQFAQAGQSGAPASSSANAAWVGAPSDTPTMFSRPAKAQTTAVAHPLRTLLITLLVIALIVAAAGGVFLAKNAILAFNVDTLQSAIHATTTAQAQNAANAAIHSPVNPYPPGGGTLVINNALIDGSSAGNWDMNGNCTMKNGYYDVAESAGTGFTYCYDQGTIERNFVYQAQVKIINGYAAGLVFRANITSSAPQLYYFMVSENGSYGLYLVSGQLNTAGQQLQGGMNTAIIRTGSNQVNTLAVVARDRYLDFYANMRYLFSFTGGSIAGGQFGVFIYDRTNAAEAAFTYVKVWQL